MAIALDTWDQPLGSSYEQPERDPNDFKRKPGTKSPYVSNPDGDTVKTGARAGEIKWELYGRPSSFGKDIENTYNLERWNERQMAIGLTIPDDTLTGLLLKLADLDPESDEGRSTADAVVARAKWLSKANLAADRGNHMHAATEDDDQEGDWVRRSEDGEVLGVPHHVQAAMIEAWRLACIAYDFEMLDVERRVVHDRWRQAGTLDRRIRLRRDVTFDNGVTLPAGSVRLLDLKTGKLYSEDRKTGKRRRKTDEGYWHSYAIQAVTYADSVPYDVHTETRGEWDEPMADDWAIIAHLPVDEAMAGKAVCRFVLVDLNAARQTVEEVILKAKEWQARRDLFAFTHPDEPVVEIPVEEPRWLDPNMPPSESMIEFAREVGVTLDGYSCGTCGDVVEQGQSTCGTCVELTQKYELVEHSMEYARTVDNTLVERLTASINQAISNRPRVTDEGPYITPQQVDDLKTRVRQLDPAAREVLNALARESAHAERPFSIADPYRRRWNIYRSLLRLGAEFGADLCEDHIRATVALVLPEIHHPGTFLGTAIGALTLDETEALVAATLRVVGGEPSLTFDEAGRPSWAGVNPAA